MLLFIFQKKSNPTGKKKNLTKVVLERLKTLVQMSPCLEVPQICGGVGIEKNNKSHRNTGDG